MEKKINYSKLLYMVTLFFITLSGFGAMPIFKRYYIADIPGLGWLAQFYVTHLIHYAAAVVLIALVFYGLFEFIFIQKSFEKITLIGKFGFFTLLGLTVSGVLLVIKNLTGVFFNHIFISLLDLTHLGLCMGLLGITIYSLFSGKRWIL